MATTPGKMTGTEENTIPSDTTAEAGRNWNRGESTTSNVSNIGEGRSAEGWAKDVQQGASLLADKAQDLASNVASRAKGFASDVASRAQDLASNAAERTTSAIREYPLQSLLVGFGIGCLVGFLIPRR